MTNVPIVVIEDSEISDEINRQKSEGDFDFVLHESFETRIKANFKEGIEGAVPFREYKDLLSGDGGRWDGLEGYAIIIADLGLEAGLDMESYSDMDLDEEIKSWAEEWVGSDTQQQGLYLIGEALKNRKWRGVIYISTSIGWHKTAAKKVKEFKDSVKSRPKVVVDYSYQAISKPEASSDVLDGAIEVFLEEFGDIGEKIWP